MLHAIPAYTGMRRGEVLRLTWVDVDLDNGYITARSRKQSRTRTETIRRIDLHAELKTHLLDWRTKRPKGQFVICDTEDAPADHKGSGQPAVLAADAGDGLEPGRQSQLVQDRLS